MSMCVEDLQDKTIPTPNVVSTRYFYVQLLNGVISQMELKTYENGEVIASFVEDHSECLHTTWGCLPETIIDPETGNVLYLHADIEQEMILYT